MKWQDDINEHLANLHPTEIIEGIIKPSMEQVISDFEDSLNLCDNKEQEQLTKKLISFWKGMRKRIE